MSMTRADALALALEEFLRQSPDVDAAAVISSDGLPMASALPSHIQEDRLGAMAAAMLSLGDRASETLGRGRLRQVFVEGTNGYVFLMAAGPAVLCAITQHKAKIGLVIFEMQRSASAVANVLLDADSRPPVQQTPPSPAPMPADPVSSGGFAPSSENGPQVASAQEPASTVSWDDYQES